ncbi:pseudouridine synthase pus4, partial [Coemansia sp. RSA 2703]
LRATGRKIRRPRTPLDLRVGHGGTLDVEAAGVLVVGLGRGCKQLDAFLRGNKAYVADARLGVATDTYDAEGRVTHVADAAHVDAACVRHALPRFVGDIWQRPPSFSAARVDGRRLYEYARAGQAPPVEPRPRCVHVASIDLVSLANPAGGHSFGSRADALPPDVAQYYAGSRRQWAEGRGQPGVGDVLLAFANDPQQARMRLAVRCGGGVYVRSLVHDIGQSVGAAATMLTLVRLAQGVLRLDRDAIAVDDLAYTDRVAAAMRHAEDVCAAA